MSARAVLLLSTAIVVFAGQAGAAEGLTPPDERLLWPQWQARPTLGGTQLAPVSLLDRGAGAVLGDYYFDAPGLRLPAAAGGLRATSGLLAPAWRGSSLLPGSSTLETTPYLGIGYTGWAVKGGWGISADLGLALENSAAGATRLGRAVFGNQGFDSALRELRLSPVLQLGVRYAF